MTKRTICQSGSRLDADTAKGLAVASGVVALSYKSVSSVAARALVDFQGDRIEFEEFPRMDDQSACMFIRLAEAGKLSMAWLRAQRLTGHIERSTILALALYADSVDLDGLPDLTASEANVLADFEGVQILLYLERLDRKMATNLAKARPELLYINVRHATKAALIALSAPNATETLQLSLESGSLSLKSAEALASYRGEMLDIRLNKTPPVNAMQCLSCFTEYLSITIPVISPKIALALADCGGSLELYFDKTTSVDVYNILANSAREIVNLNELLDTQ